MSGLELSPTITLVQPVKPTGIGIVCACGAGWPRVSPSEMSELQLELEKHLAERHPEASGYSLTLSCYPIEPSRRR